MSPTRREFIRSAAIALAALAMTRCAPGISPDDGSPRARLRRCWLRLDELAQQTQGDYERGERLRDQLTAEHRVVLDELVTAAAVTTTVSDPIQEAFVEATYHVWRANAPITCYEPVLVNYTPTSANQLVTQASLLAEMSRSSNLDPDAVARVRATIERDIAFLALSDQETEALYERLKQEAGDNYRFPSFDELDLDIPPDVIAAARFLVELLLET